MAQGDSYQGTDVLIKIGNTVIGGQRGARLVRETDPIDAGHKGTGKWPSTLDGNKKWSVECDGVVLEGDAGLIAAKAAFANGTLVTVVCLDSHEAPESGPARITRMEKNAPHDGVTTYSMTFTGSGALTQ